MDKKIVFFDIDGTIYDRKIDVTEKTKDAIKLLRQNGHMAFIATGRPMSMVNEMFLNIGFDGINAACGNYIVFHDKLMFNNEIPNDIINEVIRLSEENDIDIVFEGKDALFSNKRKSNNAFMRLDFNFKMKDWHEEKVVANKFSLEANNRDRFNKMKPFLLKHFTIIDRESDFVEVVPKGYSKATGIEYIIKHFDMPWQSTYAFGDSENDLDMMKYVCNSVAMGNAVDQIKSISKYVTDTIFDDGVYKGLKMLELI